MGSVVTSLKKLYKKLGGDKAKGVNTVDGMVNKIAEKVNAGGSGSGGSDVKLPMRIVTVTQDDVVACANDLNVVNELDIIEHAIKRHIGVIPHGDGKYLVMLDYVYSPSHEAEVDDVAIVDVYFMGSDTSAKMGISLVVAFNGVFESISQGNDATTTITIDGVSYSIKPLAGTYHSFTG